MRMVKVSLPNGTIVDGELMEFQTITNGDIWLEFLVPEDKRILRVKPSMIRIVRMGRNDLGEPVYQFHMENLTDVIPSDA